MSIGSVIGMAVACLLWVILSIIVADGATNRKRSGGGYFLLSLFLSPVIAFMILMIYAPIPVVEPEENE